VPAGYDRAHLPRPCSDGTQQRSEAGTSRALHHRLFPSILQWPNLSEAGTSHLLRSVGPARPTVRPVIQSLGTFSVLVTERDTPRAWDDTSTSALPTCTARRTRSRMREMIPLPTLSQQWLSRWRATDCRGQEAKLARAHCRVAQEHSVHSRPSHCRILIGSRPAGGCLIRLVPSLMHAPPVLEDSEVAGLDAAPASR
jgi:hypothetical protein